MLSILTITYLFLGGTGAGVISICAFLDLFCLKRWQCRIINENLATPTCHDVTVNASLLRVLTTGYTIGLLLLLSGALCLLFDLGRMERFLSLYTSPTFSIISLGLYALTILIASATALCAIGLFSSRRIPRSFVVAIESIALVFAVIVMIYTGFLLQSTNAVEFWRIPFIPVLFFLSSLSTGTAILLFAAPFSRKSLFLLLLFRRLALFDMVVIILEAFATLGLVVAALTLNADSLASIQSLVFGSLVYPFWLGFVCLGMLVPFILEFSLRKNNFLSCGHLVGFLVLIGGYCLRLCIVNAGALSTLALS